MEKLFLDENAEEVIVKGKYPITLDNLTYIFENVEIIRLWNKPKLKRIK